MGKVAEKTNGAVKVYPATKDRVTKLALRMSDREQRRVSEAELYDTFAKAALPKLEKKFGLA